MTYAARISSCTVALAAALLGAAPSAADSAPAAYSYYVVSSPLTEVLSVIAADTDVNLEFDAETVPYVTSTSLSGTGSELIDKLTRRFNLSQFEFNGRIYLSPEYDKQTRIIANETRSAAEIREAIVQSGIDLSRFTVAETANPNAIVLTAPAKLVGIVEALVASLPADPSGRRGKEVVVMRGI